jgi:hypothetical protein
MKSENTSRAGTHGVLLTIFALVLGGIGLVGAVDGACEQACQDEYQRASAECREAYQEAIDEAQAQRDQCLEDATNYFQKLRCLTDYELDKERAHLELLRCENDARVAFARCLNACQTSPSSP